MKLFQRLSDRRNGAACPNPPRLPWKYFKNILPLQLEDRPSRSYPSMKDGTLATNQPERSGNRDLVANPKSVQPQPGSLWARKSIWERRSQTPANAFREDTH